MREKLLWSAVVFLVLALVASQAQSPARSDSQIGRFQIVMTAPSAKESAQVFRLDTTTGKTWVKGLSGTELLWSAPLRESAPGK